MLRLRASLLLTAALLAADWAALAQIDPERRDLVELGFNQAVHGASPLAAYGFYYRNQPNYPWTNTTLRLAFAGIYVDSEVGFNHLLGPNTDLGIGLAGGGYADSYFEFRQGQYLTQSSFYGHAGEVSVSAYHLFNPGDKIPLNAILRLRDRFSVFERESTPVFAFFQHGSTEPSPAFSLPSDHSAVAVRAGLRYGGREPLLSPDLAMELSAWAEGQYRFDSGSYGYNGDRILQPHSEMFWARALLIYTLPGSKQTISATLNGGTVLNSDRF